MQKVLVIAYFFPPCNLTASQRAFSWAQQLHRFGFYPIVVTRRWDYKINTLADVSRSTPQNIVVEKYDTHEVHYVPYKGNLRDRIYAKYGDGKYSLVRRLLTLWELLLQNFISSVIPYNNLFNYAKELCRKDSSIKLAIASGNPFNQFKLGYELSREFNLKWIADYRDAWTTSEINAIGRSGLFKWIDKLDSYFERKWVASASKVTASSGPIATGIEELTGVDSMALYNGFVAEDFDVVGDAPKYDKFTITYVGTLYDGQKVEIFCEGYKQFLQQNTNVQVMLRFPGLAFYAKQHERIMQVMKGYESYYESSPRIDRKQILEIEKRSHLLLHVAWDEQKGIIASKIYEYLASGTRILVVPGDKSSIDEIVTNSGCGVSLNTAMDVCAYIEEQYNGFCSGKVEKNNISKAEVLQYSRLKQTENLASVLKQISGK